jgi:hypothetical protein
LNIEPANGETNVNNNRGNDMARRILRRSTRVSLSALSKDYSPEPKAPLQDSTVSMPTTVWKFGCAIKSLLGTNCSVLVLDHAERLLSFETGNDARGHINFLSQILLLPRILELNLTVILITKSALLGQSRKFLRRR